MLNQVPFVVGIFSMHESRNLYLDVTIIVANDKAGAEAIVLNQVKTQMLAPENGWVDWRTLGFELFDAVGFEDGKKFQLMLYVLGAYKPEGTSTLFTMNAGATELTDDLEESRAKYLDHFRRLYPEADGWSNHYIKDRVMEFNYSYDPLYKQTLN